MFDSSPQRNGGFAPPHTPGDIVVLDQEPVASEDRDLVVSVNGGPRQDLGRTYDHIPDGSTLYGDYNALALRTGKSLSQAWHEEDLREFLNAMKAKGVTVRVFSNFVFSNGKVEGGPDACVHLARKILSDPDWARSSSRPLDNRGPYHRAESARLHDEAMWDFRRAEDAAAKGMFPAWYDDVVRLAQDVLTADELDWLGIPKTKTRSVKDGREVASRPLLAIFFSVLQPDGTRRIRNNRSPVSPDYARRYIARLHAQGRGKGVGGSIRACLRKIGNGNSAEGRKTGDRVFMKLARALTLPNGTEAPRLPNVPERTLVGAAA